MENCYNDIRVVENFYVKGYSHKYLINTYANKNKEDKLFYENTYKKSILMRKKYIKNKSSLSLDFVDKVTPHSLFELMLIDSSASFESSIFNYNRSIQFEFFSDLNSLMRTILSNKFANNFNYALNDSICVSYNYDPLTKDRESIMSEKRFHFHIIAHTKEDLRTVSSSAISFSDIEKEIMKMRFVDPLLSLSSKIIIDLLKYYKYDDNLIIFNVMDEVKYNLPLGVKLVFKKNTEFPYELMNKIHKIIIQKYYELYNLIFIDSPTLWSRSKKRDFDYIEKNIKKINYLSDCTKTDLLERIKIIPEYSEKEYLLFKQNRKLAIQKLYLAGPAYSCTYYYNKTIDNKLYNILNIYYKTYTDLGGAGMTTFGKANAIRIKRNFGEFSESEILTRKSFQKHLLEEAVK